MYKSNLINLLISYIGLFLGLFNTIFKPKVFTPVEIGIFSTIISIAAILQLLSSAGLNSVIMRYFSKYDNSEQKAKFISSVIITSFLFLAAVIFVLIMAKDMVVSYYGNNYLDEYFVYIPLYLFLSHTIEIMERISRVVFASVKSNIIRNIFFKIANGIFLVLIFIFEIEFVYYMYFFIVLNFMTAIFMMRLSVKYLKIKLTFSDLIPDFVFLRQFLSYSFYMMISALSSTIVINIDKIMIGHYLSFGKTGIYTIAVTLGGIINLIFNSFARIAQPKLSICMSKGSGSELKKAYLENLYNNLHFGIIVFTVLVVFSVDILSSFGNEYSEGYLVIVIISSGQVFNLFTGMCGEVIALSEHYRFDFYVKLFMVFITILLNAMLIPEFGITGAAIATTANIVIYDFFKMIYAYRKFNIHPFNLHSLYFFIAGALIFIALQTLKPFMYINIYIIITVSLLSFVIYDFILGYVFRYDYAVSKKLIRRLVKK